MMLMAGSTQDAARPSFVEWLAGVRAEALARGIREAIVAEALDPIEEPLTVALERDRAQAEVVLSFEAYISRRLSSTLIASGQKQYAAHRAVLEEVADRYGVAAKIIAGIWGIESNFGRFTGIRPTIAALATLAWDPRRSAFFRGELLNALDILNRGDIDLARMRGSWAGAMGQPQFMPSSYLRFAEDFDGDGRRDIWGSPGDVFASIANYLKGHGWRRGETWGLEVRVPSEVAGRIAADIGRRDGGCRAVRDMTVRLPLAEWQRLGVRTVGGAALATLDQEASLVSGASRHFLVYRNYDALIEYNCAHAYAISVGLLGDRVGRSSTAPGTGAPAPTPAPRP